MNDINWFHLIVTIIFLTYIYIVYNNISLKKHQYLQIRLVYYGYWYWLLFSDVPKYIIILLTMGYLIITSLKTPEITTNEDIAKVNTYVLGYRRGFTRGVESVTMSH